MVPESSNLEVRYVLLYSSNSNLDSVSKLGINGDIVAVELAAMDADGTKIAATLPGSNVSVVDINRLNAYEESGLNKGNVSDEQRDQAARETGAHEVAHQKKIAPTDAHLTKNGKKRKDNDLMKSAGRLQMKPLKWNTDDFLFADGETLTTATRKQQKK